MTKNKKLTGEEIKQLLINSEISVDDFAHEEIPIDNFFSEEALKAEKEKDNWFMKNSSPIWGTKEYEEWHKNYSTIPNKYDVSRKEWLEKNNIPIWEEVEQKGGEEQGDIWYSVKYFPEHDVYLKVNGWYQSHNGANFNGWGDVEEVKPQQKTITVYE